jgi:hypothetical protein
MFNLLLILLVLFLLYKIYNTNERFGETNINMCCLYAYYEKDNKYKENFEFFLENGIYDEIDYYIIINGQCSVNIPNKKNIIIFNRENKGYDFGAWSYGLANITKEYDYYTFLNTSVKGPYLYNKCEKWYEPFIRLFNKDVKIVGTTINIYTGNHCGDVDLIKYFNKEKPFTHVQSMFFIIDKEYLDYLNSLDFFNENKLNNITKFDYIIGNYEIGLSQHALIKGWNINCILQPYKNQDYRTVINDLLIDGGDIYFMGKYFGKTIDPYDVIFFKTNRFGGGVFLL